MEINHSGMIKIINLKIIIKMLENINNQILFPNKHGNLLITKTTNAL